MIDHPLLRQQLDEVGYGRGPVNLTQLLRLVNAAYQQYDEEQQRTDLSSRRMADQLDQMIAHLETKNRFMAEAQQAAETASRSKSSFLANMSHEIRTPLNGILGMAQVLLQTSLKDDQRDYLTTLVECGETLLSLLNDILDLSKIEAGKMDIVPTQTDLRHIMARIRKLWTPTANEKGLQLNVAVHPSVPAYVQIDAVRYQQCLSNLISNAVKFTAAGHVDVAVTAVPEGASAFRIEVLVSDTGEGMDAETLGALFKPFQQADETTSRRHGGTGLGLSITRRLARKMRGDAWAVSEKGRGSVFVLTFGAEARTADSAPGVQTIDVEAIDQRTALRDANLKILLVDDMQINRHIVSLFLKPFGIIPVEATNGKEALDALRRQEFDVVLLDMHMPVMDGPETIRQIRSSNEEWARVPVVALTADAMSGDRQRHLDMGVDGYLPKPLQERDLVAELVRLCGTSATVSAKVA
ncbi:response regulator [Parvularcula sp. LCG005]|uniref:response regulator n=1 Tax=Parvularcula sp. LCG005 TaxID=3078805 RepID=UPI002942A605|nr:response regulator [Parvularcula sp. LCG005]WOI53162.1 ATP-binding protein [Parvularcula sp. LCG005]